MTALQTVLVLVCVLALAVGQLLFKLSSRALAGTDGLSGLARLAYEPYFLLSLTVYGGATVLWVWLLKELPLTVAYPFFALSFVFVPLISLLFLGEQVSLRYWAGIAMIMAGIYVTAA